MCQLHLIGFTVPHEPANGQVYCKCIMADDQPLVLTQIKCLCVPHGPPDLILRLLQNTIYVFGICSYI